MQKLWGDNVNRDYFVIMNESNELLHNTKIGEADTLEIARELEAKCKEAYPNAKIIIYEIVEW